MHLEDRFHEKTMIFMEDLAASEVLFVSTCAFPAHLKRNPGDNLGLQLERKAWTTKRWVFKVREAMRTKTHTWATSSAFRLTVTFQAGCFLGCDALCPGARGNFKSNCDETERFGFKLGKVRRTALEFQQCVCPSA